MDLLTNMIANIKGGYQNKIDIIRIQKSNFCIDILDLLYKEGYILGYKMDPLNKNKIIVFLKYIVNTPAISHIECISTQGRRSYSRISLLWQTKKLNQEKITYVLSTTSGLMTDKEALKRRLGGELLFKIF